MIGDNCVSFGLRLIFIWPNSAVSLHLTHHMHHCGVDWQYGGGWFGIMPMLRWVRLIHTNSNFKTTIYLGTNQWHNIWLIILWGTQQNTKHVLQENTAHEAPAILFWECDQFWGHVSLEETKNSRLRIPFPFRGIPAFSVPFGVKPVPAVPRNTKEPIEGIQKERPVPGYYVPT